MEPDRTDIDVDIDALFWAKRGVRLSEPFTAYPPKIIGRCNDLARGEYSLKKARAYMAYKTYLRHRLAVPESLARIADGIVVDAEFALPKTCFKKDGITPTKEGDRRLKGLVKCLPTDNDNWLKPVKDAVFKCADEVVRDADSMIDHNEKRWALENKITVWLLLPLGE